MKKLVLGYGVSGKAAKAFLTSKGLEVVALDHHAPGALPDSPDFSLEGFDQVILSPGIHPNHPLVVKAKALNREVIGEMELGMRSLNQRAFGITGSNGKTTTVLLIEHILNGKGLALGNVGKSLTEYLLAPKREDILILELSSFQLETVVTGALEACIVLNISPNHLDRHASLAEYVHAKARMQCALKEGGELFISKQVQEEFGNYFPKANLFEKNLAVLSELSYRDLRMPSKQSVEAAYLLCKRCGVTDTEFLDRLSSYQKPEHRIEWVDKIAGVSYYNDSKSSNVQSVIHAVRQFDGPLVLIVGGVHKGSSYKPWIEELKGKVKKLIVYGKAAPIIACELESHLPMVVVDRFADAVKWAKLEAKINDVVLLSPGCSSFDQFESYKQRGSEFKRLVRES